jgi:hypothetical protein
MTLYDFVRAKRPKKTAHLQGIWHFHQDFVC